MDNNLKYIELKNNQNDNGPAWIGHVKFSKSKKSFDFNRHRFRKIRLGINSNYIDEDSNNYWVSGVKKVGTNRYPWAKAKIFLQKSAVDDFLKLRNENKVDSSQYEIVDIEE